MSKKPRRVVTYRSPTGRYLEINRLIADAREHPGLWFLAFPAAPHATYLAIHHGRHVDLRRAVGGRLEAEFRNEHLHEGQRRGDVYVRWTEIAA